MDNKNSQSLKCEHLPFYSKLKIKIKIRFDILFKIWHFILQMALHFLMNKTCYAIFHEKRFSLLQDMKNIQILA